MQNANMANQNGDTMPKVNNHTSPAPLSTSNLTKSLDQLSLNSTKTSSPSQASLLRRASSTHFQTSPPPNGSNSPQRSLHRSPSSMSMYSNSHSPTPALHRSPSSMSRSPSSMSMHSTAPPLRTRTSMSSYHTGTPSRRTSPSALNVSMHKSPLAPVEDVPVYTARGIASAHFASELEMHGDVTAQRPANTIIILHDSCYGHRYSRPRTSKVSLASIVERPERVQASVLGVCVAYVRLGGRHDEGYHPLHPKREASSLPDIPFRIRKTDRRLTLSSPAVINVHGTKWMDELKAMCNSAEAKLAATGKELVREPSKSADGLPGKLHEGDLYLCAESLEAMEGALGAVCEGIDAVFQGSAVEGGPSRAFVVVRPPGHHCSSNYPSGFCWLNNVHVGIQHAILNHGLTHAAIIDFDLHHGDGSQSIAWEHNKRASSAAKNSAAWKKTSIGYFSLHDINSYPCEQGDDEKVQNASLCIENAHGQNIWNVHLETWKTQEEFWELYEDKYSVLLQKARKFLRTQFQTRSSSTSAKPKAAIFFSAGFDASEWESDGMQRHKVNVPTEFYARLSGDVVKLAQEEGLGVDGRIISVLEGGYSDRALMTGVLSHISGLTGVDPIVKGDIGRPTSGLAHEMGRKLGSFDGKNSANGFHSDFQITPYDADWWSRPRLDQLDLALNPHPVPEPFKPTRHTALGNFSSPTQSFIAKVVPHRRTSYGASIESSPRQSVARRVSSPKPPDVDWATAAHELSKLLIPSDRQVTSCKPEELTAAATRDRRERQSTLNLSENADAGPQPMGPPAPTTRMALRERKAKSYVFDDDEPHVRPASKAGRRKTSAGDAFMAGVKAPGTVTVPPVPGFKQPVKQSSRRQSLVSNAESTVSHAPSTAVTGRGRVPSVQLNGHARPETAQSIRPESSMSARTISGGRPEFQKSYRVRKTPPIADNVPKPDGTSDVPTASAVQKSGFGAGPKSDNTELDNITAGMGKIKLTLVTKAQREAREQAKKEQAKEAATKTTRKPAIPKAQKASSAKPKQKPSQNEVLQPVQPAPVVKEEPISPKIDKIELPPYTVLPTTENTVQPVEAIQAPLPPSLPPSKTSTPQKPVTPQISSSPKPAGNGNGDGDGSGNGDVFIPYQPDGPAPGLVQQQQPDNLTWLPPNTNTPAGIKNMKRHELPVFTSTGSIPFGVPGEQVTNGSGFNETGEVGGSERIQTPPKEKLNGRFDGHEVPETPDR